MKSFSNSSVNALTRSALIAALYCLLTLAFQPISFGAVQFRVAEALTLLPVLVPNAVSGLFVGCLLANMFSPSGFMWMDVVFGSIATLLAAICTQKLRKKPVAAAAMPVVFNALIVGPVVYFAYIRTAGSPINWTVLLSTAATVGFGELAVCYVLGLPMIGVLRRLPKELLTGRRG